MIKNVVLPPRTLRDVAVTATLAIRNTEPLDLPTLIGELARL